MRMEEESVLQNGKMNRVKRGHSTSHETLFCIVSSYRTAVITSRPLGGQQLMTYAIFAFLWTLNGLLGLCPLLTLIELPSLIKFGKERWHPLWRLRTRCRLMNAVEVGDPSLIPCSQWVKSMLFACFYSCEYDLGCPAFMFVLYIP